MTHDRQQYLAWQFGKVAQALHVLSVHPDDVRGRVWSSYRYFGQVDASASPPECREDIEWIHQMMVRFPAAPHDKSGLDATYRRTRRSTAVKIAERIFLVHGTFKMILQRDASPA